MDKAWSAGSVHLTELDRMIGRAEGACEWYRQATATRRRCSGSAGRAAATAVGTLPTLTEAAERNLPRCQGRPMGLLLSVALLAASTSATKGVHRRTFGCHERASQPSRIGPFAFWDIRGFEDKLERLAQPFTHPFVRGG
jgi:hypothetical protein